MTEEMLGEARNFSSEDSQEKRRKRQRIFFLDILGLDEHADSANAQQAIQEKLSSDSLTNEERTTFESAKNFFDAVKREEQGAYDALISGIARKSKFRKS